MSRSDKNQGQQWFDLMDMYFNTKLSAPQAIAWFVELRMTTKGWTHDSTLEGEDPCKGAEAAKINDELCLCIRYIADLETIPRKSEGGRSGDYKGKPNVKDLGLWIWIYRKSTAKATGFGAHKMFVERCQEAIKKLVDEGRRFDAAILAENPMGVLDCIPRIWEVGGNRGFTEQEQGMIHEYCGEINLSIHSEFVKFYEQSTGKKAVNQYASELSEQYSEEDIFT